MPVPSGSDPSSLYGAELVTVPYVTPATFKAYPSYADVGNLVVGAIQAAQNNAELYNLLVRSSQWVSDTVNVPMHAHYKIENSRNARVTRDGALTFHPSHNPVRLLTALQYSYTLGGPVYAVSDLTGQWIEEEAQINIPFGPMSTAWATIELGPPRTSSSLYTTWTYVAGYANTTVNLAANVGDVNIIVADPTGILPGSTLRIWDPGSEEAIVVGANYATGSTTVPLSTALKYAHAVGAGVSEMPSTLQLATVFHACSLLLRPDSTAEDAYPDSKTGLTTRSEDARRDGTGLVAEAYRLVRSYSRVR